MTKKRLAEFKELLESDDMDKLTEFIDEEVKTSILRILKREDRKAKQRLLDGSGEGGINMRGILGYND